MKTIALSLIYIVGVFAACQGHGDISVRVLTTPSPSVTPEPTKPPIPEDLLRATSEQLCAKLVDIKTIPTFKPTPTDPIYEALLVKSHTAIPCLIENITDKREVPDPKGKKTLSRENY